MNNNIWPISIVFEEDELLSSWLIRTALENGSDPMTWTWYYWGQWRPWTIDLDRYCPIDKLKILSNLGLDLNTLQAATLMPSMLMILDRLPSKRQTWPWITRLGSRNRERTGGLRFCIECLKEQPIYFRKSWRFAWNHSCSKHNMLLQEFCPNCNSPLTLHKVSVNNPHLSICQRCYYDLATTITTNNEQKNFQVQNLLNSIVLERQYDLPWGVESTTILFSIIRHLYSFLSYATKGITNSEKALCKSLNMNIELRPKEFKLESIEKAPTYWIRELDYAVSQLLVLNISEIYELFNKCGITQESFYRNQRNGALLLDFIWPTPQSKERKKLITKKALTTIQPKTKEEVWNMWLDLQEFL